MWVRRVVLFALTVGAVFAPSGRLLSFASVLGLFLVTVAMLRGRIPTWRRSVLAVLFGTAPMAVTVGALHDILPIVPPLPVSRILIVSLWLFGSRTLGASLAAHVDTPGHTPDFLLRAAAVFGTTAWFAGGLMRQFLPGADIVTRLSFAILEEDNAHVIGVMREVATLGPRGGELAEMYGTGFVVLPHLLIRLLGGPFPSEVADPRQAAVTTFTTSSLLVILILGLTLWTLGEAVAPRMESRQKASVTSRLTVFTVSLLATWIALAVIVVIPMRTSFLTFVWGVSLLALATAFSLMLPSDPQSGVTTPVLIHMLAAAWLLIGSWPFVVVGLLPALGMLVFSKLRNRSLPIWAIAAGLAPFIAAMSLFAVRWRNYGLLAEVLSYGRDLLTIRASEIRADRYAWMALVILLAVSVAHAVTNDSTDKRRAFLALAPISGLVLLYLVLYIAAFALTGGELNYAGDKLRYGIVALGLLIAAPLSTRAVAQLQTWTKLSLLIVLAMTIALSPTIRPDETWWDRSKPRRLPQAETVVEALRDSSSSVPLRCLPPPDLEVDRITRRAAYECVRFVEDAFNEDRRHGHRITFLATQDQTFRHSVDLALADLEPMDEFFRLTMRGGWAGLPPEIVADLPSPWTDE